MPPIIKKYGIVPKSSIRTLSSQLGMRTVHFGFPKLKLQSMIEWENKRKVGTILRTHRQTSSSFLKRNPAANMPQAKRKTSSDGYTILRLNLSSSKHPILKINSLKLLFKEVLSSEETSF